MTLPVAVRQRGKTRGKHRRAHIIIAVAVLVGILTFVAFHPGLLRREEDGGGTLPARPREEDGGGTLPARPREEDGGGTLPARPREEDGGGTLPLRPREEDGGGTLPARPREEDGGGTLPARPREEDGGGTLPVRPREEDGTLPGPFPYLINQANRCLEGEAPPFLVLLITVEAHQVERRDAIRRTWGHEGSPGAPRVVRLFLLGANKEEEEKGEPRGRRLQRTLESESLRHGDIVQQDFMDSYGNLTLKTLMGLNWVARHCPRASYVMKTDSDVFVNTENLVHELLRPEVKPRKKFFTGLVWRGTPPIRNKNSGWYVSREEYPSQTYPEYCGGLGYVFSGDLATEIYGASLSVPRFRLEDVYVGMCLDRLGIRITWPGQFQFLDKEGWRPFDRNRYSHLVISHPVTPTEMLDYWNRLHPQEKNTEA